MSFGTFISDNPWILVVFAAGIGILVGLIISLLRWRRKQRNRIQADADEDERPWECVEFTCGLIESCGALTFGRVQQKTDSLVERASLRWPLTKVAIVLLLTLITLGCDGVSMAYLYFAYGHFVDLRLNMSGDPEKVFMDSCMSDFEGLSADDSVYLAQHKKCMDKLIATEDYDMAPYIRLPVDEGICEVENLCVSSDPGDCREKVNSCYSLIDEAGASRNTTEKALLQLDVSAKCTDSGVWSRYDQHVHLNYCMWKHNEAGICTNNHRTNCPTDTSCCPTAQNYDSSAAMDVVRSNLYTCAKSPIIGLYCQHWSFAVGGNYSNGLCTDQTCSNFGWCRDFADVPGTCLTDVCKDYSRALEVLIGSLVVMGIALACDVIYSSMLIAVTGRGGWKSIVNGFGSILKLMVYMFCVAGGVSDLADKVRDIGCWNAAATEKADNLPFQVSLACLTALGGCFGALALSLVSVRWNKRLVQMPYAKSQV